jgi:hypothetical protein
MDFPGEEASSKALIKMIKAFDDGVPGMGAV